MKNEDEELFRENEVSRDIVALPKKLVHLEFDGHAIKVSLIEGDHHITVLGWVRIASNVGAQAPVSRVPLSYHYSRITGKTELAIKCLQYANLVHDHLSVGIVGDCISGTNRKIVEWCAHEGVDYVCCPNDPDQATASARRC